MPSLAHSATSAPSSPDQASLLAQSYSLIGQADVLIEDLEFLAELRHTAGRDWEDVYYGRDGGERLTEELRGRGLDEEDRILVEGWSGERGEEEEGEFGLGCWGIMLVLLV